LEQFQELLVTKNNGGQKHNSTQYKQWKVLLNLKRIKPVLIS
jgi:hypothetical protein